MLLVIATCACGACFADLGGFSGGADDAGSPDATTSDATADVDTDGGSSTDAADDHTFVGDALADSAPAVTQFTRKLTIVNGASVQLPGTYAVCFAANGILGVDLGAKVRSDFADLRVFGPSGERARVLDALAAGRMELCFRLERAIAAGASDDGYSLHYGAPDAGAPPSNPAAIFDFWEGFDGPLDTTRWLVNGAPTVSGGNLVLPKGGEPGVTTTAANDGLPGAASLDIRAKVDDPTSAPSASKGFYYWFGFQHTGDFGEFEPWTIFIARGKGSVEAEHKTATGTCTGGCDQTAVAQTSAFRIYRVNRHDAVDFLYDDGTTFSATGSNGDMSVMLRNYLVTSDVEIDWVRARPLVFPEPTATLGPEQTTP